MGEPVLFGEDGIHPWRAQEHLQGEGEARRGPVSSIHSNRGECRLRPTKKMLHFLKINDLDLNYKNIWRLRKQFKSKHQYLKISVQYLLVDFHVIYILMRMRKFPEYYVLHSLK